MSHNFKSLDLKVRGKGETDGTMGSIFFQLVTAAFIVKSLLNPCLINVTKSRPNLGVGRTIISHSHYNHLEVMISKMK